MDRRWQWLVLTLALVLTLGAAPQPQKSAVYERYDVEIEIQPDGSLLVAETYQMRFEGEFHTGFAEIPLDRADDVVEIGVREGERDYVAGNGGPGTFNVDREQDSVYVYWEYEPTSGSQVRTFTVSYRVLGGLAIHPDNDILSWTVVPEDRGGIPVEASRATVRLPGRVESASLRVVCRGQAHTFTISNADEVAFDEPAPISDGETLEIEVRLPRESRSGIEELQRIYVKGRMGNLVPIAELGHHLAQVQHRGRSHRAEAGFHDEELHRGLSLHGDPGRQGFHLHRFLGEREVH